MSGYVLRYCTQRYDKLHNWIIDEVFRASGNGYAFAKCEFGRKLIEEMCEFHEFLVKSGLNPSMSDVVQKCVKDSGVSK